MALEPRLLRRARSSLYNHMGCLGRWVAMRWYNALEGCVGLGLPCSCMEALYGMRGSIEGLILGLLPSFYSRHHCGSGQRMCWHAAGAYMVLSGWRWGQLGSCGLDMSLAELWFCGIFCPCLCFGYRCSLAAQGRGLFGECCMWQDIRFDWFGSQHLGPHSPREAPHVCTV